MCEKKIKLHEIVCKNIIDLRKEQKLTQQQIADFLGIDRSNYSKYELGKLELNLEMLVALSNLYGVSTDLILGKSSY